MSFDLILFKRLFENFEPLVERVNDENSLVTQDSTCDPFYLFF